MNKKTNIVANQKVQTENEGIKEKVKKINKELEKLILEEKYDDIIQYYADDIVICPDFHSSIKGKDSVKMIYDENKKLKIKHHSFSGNIEDIWEDNNLVYERGTFGMSYSTKDHPKPLAYYGSYFTIWKKGDEGSLKIKYTIWNLDFNPCD
jgi:ketosteroid isomerase-like protein